VVVIFLGIYLSFIVWIKTRVCGMEPRYLTPAMVVLFLLISCLLDRATTRW